MVWFFLRFYLFIHKRHTHTHTHTQRGRDIGRERSREPNVELDPRTMGSLPGPKADAQLLSHPGIPSQNFSSGKIIF